MAYKHKDRFENMEQVPYIAKSLEKWERSLVFRMKILNVMINDKIKFDGPKSSRRLK